jgi:cystathionine beta-lyase
VTSWFDSVDVERLRRRRSVKWTLYGPDVLAAWVAEMDFDVAPVVRDALVAGVEREDFGYPMGDLSELTEACASFLEEVHGWTVPPVRIFPIADVLAGVTGALEAFSPAGCSVVVPTPAYPPFFEIVELTGRRVVEVAMVEVGGRFVLDTERIDRALGAGARAVLLCNPHNPTGRAFEHAELHALSEIVERHGARVVSDEVHAPLVLPGCRHLPYASVSEDAAGHSVTVVSASKAFNLAGLKCAQLVATNHRDAVRLRNRAVFEIPGPTPLGIDASVAAYRSGRAWLRDLVAHLDGNRSLLRDLLAAELPEVGFHVPDATFLAWLDCTALGFVDPASHFLERARVAVSDGPPFGAGHEQHVRLNFATSGALLQQIVGAMAHSRLA